LLLLSVAVLAGGIHLWSAAEGAGDAAHFLRDGVGARPRVLGGAFAAVADDVHALFWNPAGIVGAGPSVRLGGTHESRFGGLVTLDAVGATLAEDGWAVGVGWVSADMYAAFNVAFAAEYQGLSAGLSPKLYHFGTAEQRARGAGLDAGVLYRLQLGEVAAAMGLVSKDIGWTGVSWSGIGPEVADHAAWVTRLGGAAALPVPAGSVLITADVEAALRRPLQPEEADYLSKALQLGAGCGVEFKVGPLFVRGGVSGRDLEARADASLRVSFGAGVTLEGVSLDAGWISTPLGGTYLLSVQMGW